jgi:hypothetical protein
MPMSAGKQFWFSSSLKPDIYTDFVALASAALFMGAGGSVSGIWGAVNTQLAAANTSAS